MFGRAIIVCAQIVKCIRVEKQSLPSDPCGRPVMSLDLEQASYKNPHTNMLIKYWLPQPVKIILIMTNTITNHKNLV